MPGANRYTTTEFLASVRRKAHIPSSQTPYGDSDILAIADEELRTSILKQILSTRENYYVTYLDTTANATGLYAIPPRAIGGALADIHLVISSVVYQMARCDLGEIFSTITSPSGYYSFYLRGNYIQALPAPTLGSVRQWYYQRPNTLVAVSAAAQITAINTSTNTLTFSSMPSTFTTATALDFIKDQPNFDWWAIDQTPTVVTTTTLQFSTTLPTELAVGDWVALAGQTPIPQIPLEYVPVLTQRVVVKYCEIQGYLDKMKAAQKKLEEMEKDTLAIINPRVAEEPKRIVPDSNLIGGFRRWRAWRAT